MGRSKVVMWMWYNICGTTATLKTESKAGPEIRPCQFKFSREGPEFNLDLTF